MAGCESRSREIRSKEVEDNDRYQEEKIGLTGIEPAHLAVLDPKSSASASSATAQHGVSNRDPIF